MAASSSIDKRRHLSLFRATSLVSLMTTLSRISGFARDLVLAQLFGAAAGIDAFFVAFKIPNFMRRLFAEGAFSQAFVPVLAGYQSKQSHQQTRIFLSKVLGNLGMVLLLVTLLGMWFSPTIIRVFTPGFSADGVRYDLAVGLLRINFPYLLFISITAMMAAVLNTYGRYALPAITPVFLNLSLLVGAYWGVHYLTRPVYALAWAVLVAGLLQFAFQLPSISKLGLGVWPRVDWRDAGVRQVLKLMLPALFGVSVAQINLLVDTFFASFLPVGSISWLYYSDRLVFFPLGIFGVAISTVILPHLSRHHALDNDNSYSNSLDWAIRMVLLLGVPSAVSLCAFGKPIVDTLLGYGRFGVKDVLMTYQCLFTFSLGIPSFMLIKVLASAFYASKDVKTPVKAAVVAMVANIVFCVLLVKPLAHAGLALSSSLSSTLNAFILLVLLLRRRRFSPQHGWRMFLLKLCSANFLILTVLVILNQKLVFTPWPALGRFAALGVIVTVCCALYLLVLRWAGITWRHVDK